ncbi:cysteine desulfurase [Patescibacteria group bacterium]|nr:cysteine desulfurase [Patescibacteria group bacterium]MBU1016303.1 cysteine desulfurase [Patescibacteria group bacterium]MBU1685579.1 cysteine desulfurase [Patescibacteria group bacterium]MBU1938504.1 cysteine desulfurase [Patescibacteria group bacterium]
MDFKKDFPIFQHRPQLIYLDNAATSQKPLVVLDAEKDYYERLNSNIHRSAHFLAEEATIAYEETRQTVADFIGTEKKHEIVFTRNATEGINLVARSYGDACLQESDEVLLSKMEHHSNIVPWLQLKERKGVNVRYLDIDENGQFVFDSSQITSKTKFVSLTGMSNILGSIPDLKPIIAAAHAKGAKILIDACQLAVHSPINVQELDADFLVFSAHKMYGPTGVGVLYGKEELLKKMPPFLGGGEMIQEVFEDRFTPNDIPQKFEAGTPNISGVVTFKAAIDYIGKIGFDKIRSIEQELTEYTLNKLSALPYLKLIGPKTTDNRSSVISFAMEGIHPHDIAEGLSQKNICIRAGHHCGQILMDTWGLPATARISLAFYNTKDDIEQAVHALEEVYKYFH